MSGDNASPHIKYALALAYRADFDWDNALEAYLAIMKNENNISDFRKMVDGLN